MADPDVSELIDGLIDDAARDRVLVTGSDAGSYLQSQLSQRVVDLSPGERRLTFVLEPTGKITVLARVMRVDDDTFELDTDAGFGEVLQSRLDRFRIRVDAATLLEPASAAEPDEAHETSRVAAGWPRMGTEIQPGETIPATTGLVELAVDFTKGCYPGQELVERMSSRAVEAPTSLRIIDVADGAQVGDPILDAAGQPVGTLTSVAGEHGLGFVKRGHDVGRRPSFAS